MSKYYCKCCNYDAKVKGNYTKHLKTNKHKNIQIIQSQTGDETREMLSLGDVGTGKRQGTIDFLIVGFVKGTTANIDTLRNQLIEVIEETLDADITRNGNALNTQVIEANTDEGVLFPYGGIRIVVRVLYEFVRGTA